MLTARQLHGCYVALISPMTMIGRELVLDIPAFRRLLVAAVEAGCTGVVVGGTTGQSCTLTPDELTTLVHEACHFGRDCARAAGRELQVLAGAGSNSTQEAVVATKRLCAATEVDALLHVTGYYNNPPQEGLLRHFTEVADAAAEFGRSIVLYNVPGRTKSNLEARTAIRLAAHPAIIGLKEASGDLAQIRAICDNTDREGFTMMAGEDDQVVAIMRAGGSGVISASANGWPREFQVLTELAAAGRWEDAEALQAALMPAIRAVFAAKNPIPLHHMFGTRIRLPLVEVSDLESPAREKVEAIIDAALAIASFPHVTPVQPLPVALPESPDWSSWARRRSAATPVAIAV